MTPPLVVGPPGGCPCGCALTPATSYGFDVIDFARDVLAMPLDPWQELAAIHAGELLPDGRPRFRVLLILVARQNGKTLLAKVLILYWMFLERLPLTMITSSDRSYAKRAWLSVVKMAQTNAWLAAELAKGTPRLTISEESLETTGGAELVFAANNGNAGRSTTLHRWLCDELREHRSRDCWDAASNAQNAVHTAQTICVTNQGDDEAIVLEGLRTAAIEFIETGVGDARTGILEWSAPDGADVDNVAALAQANPNLGRPGHGPDVDALRGAAQRAKRAGGEELTGFRTEVLCQKVKLLDPAIDPDLWDQASGDVPNLADHRQRVALCVDIAMAADHATLVAAAEIDGKVYLDVQKAWSGPDCVKQLRADLPGIVAQIRPRVVGWLPSGPAAVLAADMQENRPAGWPPRRVAIQAITADAPAVCMALSALVRTGEVVHAGDPLLNLHTANAQKLRMGDRWVFGRRGTGPVDAAYAAAGAVHLARTLPPGPAPLVAL
jgi:hypothetical protein